MKRMAVAIVLCLVVIVLAGCGKPDEIDISAYADRTIELVGVEDEPVTVTISDLQRLTCKTIETESTSDKIGRVRATGVWLDTVLADYGMRQKDLAAIRIIGADEYDTKLRQEYLKDHKVMLAFGIDGKPLDEESAPCRVIIKESDSAYWVRQVTRIECER